MSKVNPTSHTTDLEYCLLPEQRKSIAKEPTKHHVILNFWGPPVKQGTPSAAESAEALLPSMSTDLKGYKYNVT